MDPNYFTCTLGQAAALRIQQPHKTVTALVDALAKERPSLPAVGFPLPGDTQEEPWRLLQFTFRDIRAGSEHTAQILSTSFDSALLGGQTVGLLCPSTPDFLFTWLALMRLGKAVLLIAPQCQPDAIANLCKTCEVGLLLYDDVYAEQAQDVTSQSELKAVALPFGYGQIDRERFIPLNNNSEHGPFLHANVEVHESQVAYLHHTSGTSSGMPKPIPQSHRAGVGVLPSFKQGHKVATFTTTPLYHGGIADLFRAWTSNAMIYLFPGKAVPITALNIVRCLDVASAETRLRDAPPVKYFSSVPYVLQMMEADLKGLRYLQTMDIVGVGGAALPTEVGDKLVNSNVNLISRFGSAECGFLLSSHRDYRMDKEWQYLRAASGAEDYIRFEAQADDGSLSELVVQPGWPHMAKCNRGDGSYATSDLFAKHENLSNAWRYHSRADSHLTLITGKKFDPAPLEASIATSSLLSDVLIFGTGRPYPGALMFRSPEAKRMSDEELLEQAWPIVEKLNAGSQDHARIARSMLVPMSVLSEPLGKSSKGTILRGAAETRFQKEIETAYSTADDADPTGDVPDHELHAYIAHTIKSTVAKGGNLTSDTDLFAFGVDSVAGMQIRSKLRRLLPPHVTCQLPINVVEDCGTVEQLVEYIRRRRHGDESTVVDAEREEFQYMHELVEQYGRFNTTTAERDVKRQKLDGTKHAQDGLAHGDVVVLTGATGALGAHILDQHRSRPSTQRVYCLVRGANDHAARECVDKALVQRQLKPIDADDKVVVLRATLSEERLGLSGETYATLTREVTTILHVAWSVNFRMKLRSFVKDSIAGVTNLVNLALASTRREAPFFGFCSSVASSMAYSQNGELVPEEVLDDPSAADSKGYSRSKWVAEHICHRAGANTRLKGNVRVFRVGQLTGDTMHGVWNTKEAYPMMLSAVNITHSLPALVNEPLNWLPVDIAATALIEGTEAHFPSEDAPVVFHVLNDNTLPTWTDLLGWLERRIDFAVVEPHLWVERLEAAVNDTAAGSAHPAAQLLDFWREAYRQPSPSSRHDPQRLRPTDPAASDLPEPIPSRATFDMRRTRAAIPVLRRVEPVSEAFFCKLWAWIQTHV
ncbi:Acetyl CoA synthetase-like protein [Teratosphaeria destructans]|uniref:Acetyl CoA synthetase-like protein n=1 Tax=Teratosphaeria destructans TaxID=418781 RepID=A0A9W7W040_9PEZI|nr:Acetyl CoA synthetase-like protein [Teratosphaeria destructans]